MAFKQSKHIFTGMSRDLSDDKQKAEFYIEAHNIRITAREDTTLLSVTNEKGNELLIFTPQENNSDNYYNAQYVGHAVLNDYLILFVTNAPDTNPDTIWRLDLKTLKSKKLFNGNLNFQAEHPIETLVDYETDAVQKVYWTDGINQPRLINIVNSYTYNGGVDTQFDFVPEVYPNGVDHLSVYVEKLTGTEGMFAAGTVQYFITYYNKFGQESNVVWQSPLLYASPLDRGGSPTETVSNSFRLIIDYPTETFDYVRIYSVQHTSENTDITARRIIDLPIASSITYVDNGTTGEAITPSDLYYKGGVPTAVGTMTAKDQTLFLGNIEIKNRAAIPDSIKNTFRNTISNSLEYISQASYAPELPGEKYYDYVNQLNYTSSNITTFKYQEEYRFGLQFQDKWGRWSEPVFLKDLKNDTITPTVGISMPSRIPKTFLAKARLLLYDAATVNELMSAPYNYVKVRPVIVLPQENERECVAQGVLCPTVYNVQDRLDNSPFAQPSWFFRPYWPISWPYQVSSVTDDNRSSDYGTLLPYAHNGLILGGQSQRGEIEKSYSIQGYYTNGNKIRISKKGQESFAEHNFFPNYYDYYNGNKEKDLTKIIDPTDFYYIDQSLVTLNSPDIDFGTIPSTDGLSFRVIGALNITGYYGTMSLETEYSPNNFWEGHTDSNGVHLSDTGVTALGWYKQDVAVANFNNNGNGEGWRLLANGPYWLDVPYYYWKTSGIYEVDYMKPAGTGSEFIVYPWQSTGSLGGGSFNISNLTAPQNGTLKHKIISNLRYSPETVYMQQPLEYATSDIQLVDDVANSTVMLKASENLYYKDTNIAYYGSIDKLLSIPVHTDGNAQNNENYGFDISVANREFTKEDNPTNAITAYEILRRQRIPGPNTAPEGTARYDIYKKFTATSITYKSSPHAVIALSPTDNTTLNILPSVNGYGTIPEYRSDSLDVDASNVTGDHNLYPKQVLSDGNKYTCVTRSFWQKNNTPQQFVIQKNINLPFQENGGILLIGELYRPSDLIVNKFGGTTEDAIQQNVWIPAGESINLFNGVTIDWTEGDTYFQRYDCLKTYPYSDENENNIVEILSFLCETRVNIAGRYDKNRGLLDNTYITNENFNLLNSTYNQKNNFFSYRILDDRFDIDKFRTQLTWSKIKSAGALTDNWTNITLANTLDLDGDKGELVSLNRYKNDVIAFQPKGISQIIYNPNVQVSTNSGIPIEIANSGKVQGKRYLYEGIGCQNKWSICDEVYSSIYFIDNFAKSIYKLSDQGLISLTDTKGFKEWMHTVNKVDPWYPFNTSRVATRESVQRNFRVFYDKMYKDVYFVNDETTLVYSDLLDQFISFMDYQLTDGMFNTNGEFYAIYDGGIWKQFAGEYNKIYDKYRNYDITFIENQNPDLSKIFTNLEYTSDTWEMPGNTLQHFETFDTIRAFNEYQDTNDQPISKLIDVPQISSLQKKFRVWRIQIPRDKKSPMNRISNTWTKFTLKKNVTALPNNKKNHKIELHDSIVGYYF